MGKAGLYLKELGTHFDSRHSFHIEENFPICEDVGLTEADH